MLHRFVAGVVGASCLLVAQVSWAQTAPPGTTLPDEGDPAVVYDVTVIGFAGISSGTYEFAADEPVPEEPGTSSVSVTAGLGGTFSSLLNEVAATGTWTAIDVNGTSIFQATATVETSTANITGTATTTYLVGTVRTTATASTGAARFLRALFNTSIVIGTPGATEEPPPEEPPTEEPTEM